MVDEPIERVVADGLYCKFGSETAQNSHFSQELPRTGHLVLQRHLTNYVWLYVDSKMIEELKR